MDIFYFTVYSTWKKKSFRSGSAALFPRASFFKLSILLFCSSFSNGSDLDTEIFSLFLFKANILEGRIFCNQNIKESLWCLAFLTIDSSYLMLQLCAVQRRILRGPEACRLLIYFHLKMFFRSLNFVYSASKFHSINLFCPKMAKTKHQKKRPKEGSFQRSIKYSVCKYLVLSLYVRITFNVSLFMSQIFVFLEWKKTIRDRILPLRLKLLEK